MLSLNCIFAFLFVLVLANTRCLGVSTSERSSYRVWTLQDEELARDRNIGRIQYKSSSSSSHFPSPSSSQASKEFSRFSGSPLPQASRASSQFPASPSHVSSRFSGSPSQASRVYSRFSGSPSSSQASRESSHFSPSSFPSEASRASSAPSFSRYSASPSQFESSASRRTASASSSTSSSRTASSLPLRSTGKVRNPSSSEAAEPVLVRLNTVKDNSVWTDEGLSRDGHLGRVQYKTASSPRHSSSPSLSPASRAPSARSPLYSSSRTEDAELNERVGSLFNSIDQNQDGFMDSRELTRASHANNVRITEAEARTAANVAFNKAKFGDLLSFSPSSKPTDLLHFLIHATGTLNRPRNIGFRTLTSSDLKKEFNLKLQHVFLYLDVDQNCVLEASDLVSISNDINIAPISAEIAGNLLTFDSEAVVGVDFIHWKTLMLNKFIKSNIGHIWREVFDDVEKILGGALPPVTDTAIQKAAKFAVDTLALGSKIDECFQIDLVNVQAASVKGRDDGVEYKLELKVNTFSGSNCVDQVSQVVKVVVLKPLPENCLDASSLRLIWEDISSEIICAPDEFSSGVCSCEAGVGGARTVCTANQGCTSAGTCQDACIPNQENSGGCMCKDPNSNSGVFCPANQKCTSQGTCVAGCTAGETNSAECICGNAGVVCSAGQGCGQDGSCVDVCSTDKINSGACFCKLSIGNSGTTCSAGKGCGAGTCIDVCTADESNSASCFCKSSPTGDSGKACSANQGCTQSGDCHDVCTVDETNSGICFCKSSQGNSGELCAANQGCGAGACLSVCTLDVISGDNCFCKVADPSISGTSCSVGQGCNQDGCLDVCSQDEISPDSCFCKDPNSVSGITCSSNQGCDDHGHCLDACIAGEVNSAECICSAGVVCSANQGCGQDGACYDACTADNLATDNCFCKSQTDNSGEKCSTGLGCDAAGNCLQVCTAGETNAASCFCKTSANLDTGKACSASQGCTDTGECLDVCDQNPDNVCFCEGENNQGVECTASKICDNGKCYEASSFPDNKCFLEHLFQYNIGTNHYDQIRIPEWTITVEGTTLSQIESARPSVGITQLGDPTKSTSFKGEIHSDDDTDGDVLGMVFGFNDATNFFVVASSRDEPGPTNWYVGRVHATCGVSCHNTKDISNAIWKPSDHPNDITVLKQGNSPWLAGKRYEFSICFNPAELLMDVTVTEKDTGAVVLDTAGKVTAATGKTDVDDISRKGGYIGVYVDSQKQVHWTALECGSCDIPACAVGSPLPAECFCSDGANGGTLCAAGQSCDGAGGCGTFPNDRCFKEDTNILFHDIGRNQYSQNAIPSWTIGQGGSTLSQFQNTRPSLGVTDLGDPSKRVSYNGQIYSDALDGDVIGIVFGFQDPNNFFIVASSRDSPGPTNWYVGRVHATCGSTCITTTTISDAIWNPTAHPTQITVLKSGTTHWLIQNNYKFSICFDPAKLLMDITVINETNGNTQVLVTGPISGATGITDVDAKSRLGGFIGVYVDSQMDTHWEGLECTTCIL